jgi:hypothetical protein
MAKQEIGTNRSQVTPEQPAVDSRRQVREDPGADGDEDRVGKIDTQEEPAVVPDRDDNGPVFDLADGPPALFDRVDMDPDEERDDGDGVEIHRGKTPTPPRE